jgi:hypothetical protein
MKLCSMILVVLRERETRGMNHRCHLVKGPYLSGVSGSQSMIPGSAASALPEKLLEMQILSLHQTLGLWNQKFWEWPPTM